MPRTPRRGSGAFHPIVPSPDRYYLEVPEEQVAEVRGREQRAPQQQPRERRVVEGLPFEALRELQHVAPQPLVVERVLQPLDGVRADARIGVLPVEQLEGASETHATNHPKRPTPRAAVTRQWR